MKVDEGGDSDRINNLQEICMASFPKWITTKDYIV